MSLQIGTRVRVNERYGKLPGDFSVTLVNSILGPMPAGMQSPRVGKTGSVVENRGGAWPYLVRLDDENSDAPYAEGELDILEEASA